MASGVFFCGTAARLGRMKYLSMACTAALLALPAAAQEAPALLFPVDCDLGETCFIQQVMDRDPGPGARDFTCGPASYDGHTGTDIRVADFEAMLAGVPVLAAAAGTVRAIRDGVPDGGTAAAPDGQGCGNGVAILHADGWETQYCHLLNGSIAVAPGDEVQAGAALGQIGYSGFTDFPHVEFILRRDGQEVDPFDPSDLGQCGLGAEPLWQDEIALDPGGILSLGFADAIPEFSAIRDGTADAIDLSAGGDALVIWAYVHNGRAGDTISLEITAPDGSPYHRQEVMLERTQAELFRASGRRIADALPPGRYIGTVTLRRDGAIIDWRETTVPLR